MATTVSRKQVSRDGPSNEALDIFVVVVGQPETAGVLPRVLLLRVVEHAAHHLVLGENLP